MAGTGGTSFAPSHGEIKVDLRDEDENVVLGSIDTSTTSLPTGAGYAVGCILRDKNGGANDAILVNEGTTSVASFVGK